MSNTPRPRPGEYNKDSFKEIGGNFRSDIQAILTQEELQEIGFDKIKHLKKVLSDAFEKINLNKSIESASIDRSKVTASELRALVIQPIQNFHQTINTLLATEYRGLVTSFDSPIKSIIMNYITQIQQVAINIGEPNPFSHLPNNLDAPTHPNQKKAYASQRIAARQQELQASHDDFLRMIFPVQLSSY